MWRVTENAPYLARVHTAWRAVHADPSDVAAWHAIGHLLDGVTAEDSDVHEVFAPGARDTPEDDDEDAGAAADPPALSPGGQLWLHILGRFPDDVMALTRSSAHALGIDAARAAALAERALVLAPDDDQALLLAARSAQALGRRADAQRHFRRLVQVHPKAVLAYGWCAHMGALDFLKPVAHRLIAEIEATWARGEPRGVYETRLHQQLTDLGGERPVAGRTVPVPDASAWEKLDVALKDFRLSVPATKAVMRLKAKTVGDLIAFSDADVQAVSTASAVAELNRVLGTLGLSLGAGQHRPR